MRWAIAVVSLSMCTLVSSCRPAGPDDSPQAVVARRFAAVARHDLETIVGLYANDAVETSPAFCADRIGQEGVRRTYSELFTRYPTITAEEPTFVVQGDRVAVQFLARTRTPDGSIAFEGRLANFLVVKNGRIVRDDTYYDTGGQPCS